MAYKGKVAVVTGASSGIGAAIAEKFLDLGLHVVALARRLERLHELSEKVKNKPGKLYPIKADVTKEEEVIQAIRWADNELGGVHILVNNAGVVADTLLLDGGETEKWRKVFETNVIGLCVATREAVQIMKNKKIDGFIININSIAGHKIISAPGINVYSASKHAVTNITECVRMELLGAGSKIRVTSISPGLVETEIFDGVTEGFRNMILGGSPVLQAKDIANAVAYVLSVPPHVQIQDIIIRPVGELL